MPASLNVVWQGPSPKAAMELMKIEGMVDTLVSHVSKGWVFQTCLSLYQTKSTI
jgi:hypothetical protein